MEDQKITAIKKSLEKGEHLTVLSALDKFKTTELRSAISRLKKRGLKIISKRVPGEVYNEYFLSV